MKTNIGLYKLKKNVSTLNCFFGFQISSCSPSIYCFCICICRPLCGSSLHTLVLSRQRGSRGWLAFVCLPIIGGTLQLRVLVTLSVELNFEDRVIIMIFNIQFNSQRHMITSVPLKAAFPIHHPPPREGSLRPVSQLKDLGRVIII